MKYRGSIVLTTTFRGVYSCTQKNYCFSISSNTTASTTSPMQIGQGCLLCPPSHLPCHHRPRRSGVPQICVALLVACQSGEEGESQYLDLQARGELEPRQRHQCPFVYILSKITGCYSMPKQSHSDHPKILRESFPVQPAQI